MKEYWYLREGDFLPETIDIICKSWKKSRRSIVEFLSKSANIFTSKEDATLCNAVISKVPMKLTKFFTIH